MRRLRGGVFGGGLLGLCSVAMLPGLSGRASLGQQPTAQAAPAQSGAPRHPGERRAGMSRVAGEVTAVSGAEITIRTESGETAQIVTTDNTRVMKASGPVKVSDLHPGDGLMAFGNLDPATNTLHAAMVMAEDAAQVKAMRENLGKTYITGRVTAVNLDDARMTVERPDHVAQTIGLDEGTSFRRAVRGERGGGQAGSAEGAAGNGAPGGGGRGGGMGMAMGGDPAMLDRAFDKGESITLADIRVGDFVAATGAMKSGVFVPVHLLDSPRRGRGEAAPAGANAPTGQPGPGGR